MHKYTVKYLNMPLYLLPPPRRYYFHDYLNICLFIHLSVCLFVSTIMQILLLGSFLKKSEDGSSSNLNPTKFESDLDHYIWTQKKKKI